MIPPINDVTLIRELIIGDNLPPQAVKKNGWPTDAFYVKCISTTLIVSKSHFQDVFKKLKKGDTFKAVIDKHYDKRLAHFKYFLRIDKGGI